MKKTPITLPTLTGKKFDKTKQHCPTYSLHSDKSFIFLVLVNVNLNFKRLTMNDAEILKN